jgi:hypothetical protein
MSASPMQAAIGSFRFPKDTGADAPLRPVDVLISLAKAVYKAGVTGQRGDAVPSRSRVVASGPAGPTVHEGRLFRVSASVPVSCL